MSYWVLRECSNNLPGVHTSWSGPFSTKTDAIDYIEANIRLVKAEEKRIFNRATAVTRGGTQFFKVSSYDAREIGSVVMSVVYRVIEGTEIKF